MPSSTTTVNVSPDVAAALPDGVLSDGVLSDGVLEGVLLVTGAPACWSPQAASRPSPTARRAAAPVRALRWTVLRSVTGLRRPRPRDGSRPVGT
ncbi:hypothetical protein GCM10027519_21550 [Kineococcus endophyticus]